MPSLLPLAIHWWRGRATSDGPLVKMLSRCGFGVGAEAEEDFAGVVHVHVVVHHHDIW